MTEKTPLTQLKGADKLPQKKETYTPTDEQVGNGAYYDLQTIEGNNQAVDQLSTISVVLDEEETDEVLYDIAHSEYGDAQTTYDLTIKEDRLKIIEALAKNPARVVQLERI